MDFALIELTDAQRSFADDVQEFLSVHVTQEVLDYEVETGEGFSEQVHLALGARGWLTPTWSAEEGGAALDPVECRILELELAKSRLPRILASTTQNVWPAVERYLDAGLLPEVRAGVAAGRVRFCLGYTEPDGGSDIASAKVRAVKDGDEWVINGSKMFTTGAQNAQYCFLLTRSDRDLPKHKGLTMFLVPMDSPGIEIQAVPTYGGERTNIVYFGDVRVSDRYRLGEINGGWSVLRGPLDQEHSLGGSGAGLSDIAGGRGYLRALEAALDGAIAWSSSAKLADGTAPAEHESVLERLGQVATDLEAGISTPGPMGRVAASDILVRGASELMDLVGPAAVVPEQGDGAVAHGSLEYAHRYAQGTGTYGGTVEIFRNLIAVHMLGLPQLELPGRKDFIASSS